MFLSNRDIKWAIDGNRLILNPRPETFVEGYDETSIDLHLDHVQEAKIWDVEALKRTETNRARGTPEVRIGSFNYGQFAEQYLIAPPDEAPGGTDPGVLVYRRGAEILVKPGGFLLWQTKEEVGTPTTNPDLICFVDGKSTRARTGILVHLTAPTIHAGWSGKIALEIANLGPFHFVLQENDVIAQLTVASISSPPDHTLKKKASATAGQRHVSGKPAKDPGGRSQSRRGKSK